MGYIFFGYGILFGNTKLKLCFLLFVCKFTEISEKFMLFWHEILNREFSVCIFLFLDFRMF